VDRRRQFDRQAVAVVLGLFDTGLAVVRSLAREGVDVVGYDSDRKMPGFRSRYCRTAVCPDPIEEPERLRDFLVAGARSLGRPAVLYPASDAFTLFLSRYRQDLSEHYRFALSCNDVVEAAVDKRKQHAMARRAGMKQPAAFFPRDLAEVETGARAIEYPAFVKPYVSHLWHRRFGEIKGFKVYSPGDLVSRFRQIAPTGLRVMVQSIVPGPTTNLIKVSVYVGRAGAVLALFTHYKIRQYPPEFGTGSLVASMALPELAELGLRFYERIGYRGIGDLEFKKDARDGLPRLIELNPRFWQQNALATRCGINFPLIEYLDLTDQAPEPQTEFREKVKWFDLGMDFLSFYEHARRDGLSLAGWLRSIRGTECFARFAWDDIRPAISARFLKAPRHMLGNDG